MKNVMTIGVVSVALASAALLAPTAIAAPKGSDLRHENSVSDKKGRQSAGQSYYKTSPLKTSKPSVYRSRGRYDRDRSIYNRDQSHHLSHRERRRAVQDPRARAAAARASRAPPDRDHHNNHHVQTRGRLQRLAVRARARDRRERARARA